MAAPTAPPPDRNLRTSDPRAAPTGRLPKLAAACRSGRSADRPGSKLTSEAAEHITLRRGPAATRFFPVVTFAQPAPGTAKFVAKPAPCLPNRVHGPIRVQRSPTCMLHDVDDPIRRFDA